MRRDADRLSPAAVLAAKQRRLKMQHLQAIEGIPLSAEDIAMRSEEHTSELQSLMRISYAVFCLKKKQRLTTTYNELNKLSTINENSTCIKCTTIYSRVN